MTSDHQRVIHGPRPCTLTCFAQTWVPVGLRASPRLIGTRLHGVGVHRQVYRHPVFYSRLISTGRWYLEFLSGIAKDWRNKFAEKDQQFNFIHPVSNFCISVWAQQEVTLLTVTLFTFFFSPLLNINISLHSYTPLYLELIFNYLLNQTGKLGCSTWSQWDRLERWTCSLGRVGWEWELLCQPQDHARTPHPSILWRHKMTTLPGAGPASCPKPPWKLLLLQWYRLQLHHVVEMEGASQYLQHPFQRVHASKSMT